ncbi:XRE family transcriptional regulator [Neobacillus notoginsengisoli]|uniref:XRE family transcriptional regulator n=1 Tax=Neobacillus notoginsengisoli TaxID=1578198 RepID=A0A417YY34_9BACI|nr:helix-turn-helix transcriptional regulator [Neobacillus notoginsengisoli]RHW42614.1 XRE family transcriptional regulator [Neobacillus notoginsengisoli]
MSTIGENIRAGRKLRSMSIEELARKARIGVHTIEQYENGEKIPVVQTVLKISTVLDIPASELLENAYQPNAAGLDYELEQLVKEIGTKRAKMILRKAKEIPEEEFLKAMDMLH